MHISPSLLLLLPLATAAPAGDEVTSLTNAPLC